MKKDDIFWGFLDSDKLFDSVEEVIEDFYEQSGEDVEDNMLTIHEYKRMEFKLAGSPIIDELESIYYEIDEEHGNPEGAPTQPSDAVKAKAKELEELIETEYVNYWCEPTGNVEVVDYQEWLKETREEREG